MKHELGRFFSRLTEDPEPGMVYSRPRKPWEGTPYEEAKVFPFVTPPPKGGTMVLPPGTDVQNPAAFRRIVNSLEEVQALEYGSVVHDSWNMVWLLMPDGEGHGHFWLSPGDEEEYPDTEIGLPAIVIWEGQP